MSQVLNVKNLTQRFGGLVALEHVDMCVNEGEIVGIIGPNGAGKSTLFNCITGIYNPTEGRVEMLGKDITGWKPYKVTELGFARTFQNIRLFRRMTVLDNVLIGMHTRTKTNLLTAIFNTRAKRKEMEECEKKAVDLLRLFELQDLRYEMATSLPYGSQRDLEIARALASNPRLLLLDEPAAGMNESETETLRLTIGELKRQGYTVLLIEHDMKFVMNICERIYVLDNGRLIGSGTPRGKGKSRSCGSLSGKGVIVMPLLELKNVSVNYGSIRALKGINLTVDKGEIITLIGANGAGKSTIMKTIMGLKRCDQGTITFNGDNITNKDTRVIVHKRIILSPEGRQIFPEFTVKDNLLMGAYSRSDSTVKTSMGLVYDLFPKLKDRESQVAGTLSGGEQQMLALGRAMMGQPELLLLDEPSLGLAPLIINEIFREIKRINELGTTILLVEQNAKVALKHSHRAYVLETGKVVLSDTAQALLESDKVQQAYFGGLVEE